MKTLKLLFVFLCFQLVSPAQVPPSVFVPVNLAYNSSKSGAAILKNGKTLNGKFYYSSPAFSSKRILVFYENGEKRKRQKFLLTEFSEVTLIGSKTGKKFIFTWKDNGLLCFDGFEKPMMLNSKSFKKIK